MPYELYKERNTNTSHLYVFGFKCFIINNVKDNLGKFDAKVDEDIFIWYSTSSKSFRVFNKRNLTTDESVHVTFDECNPKTLEVEVIDYAIILGKTNMEDGQHPDQGKNKNKVIGEKLV